MNHHQGFWPNLTHTSSRRALFCGFFAAARFKHFCLCRSQVRKSHKNAPTRKNLQSEQGNVQVFTGWGNSEPSQGVSYYLQRSINSHAGVRNVAMDVLMPIGMNALLGAMAGKMHRASDAPLESELSLARGRRALSKGAPEARWPPAFTCSSGSAVRVRLSRLRELRLRLGGWACACSGRWSAARSRAGT